MEELEETGELNVGIGITGIGRAKLTSYGEAVLAVVRGQPPPA